MNILSIPGIRLAAVSAGIKTHSDTSDNSNSELDLVAVEVAVGSVLAAVFTQNAFCAAPVYVAKKHLMAATPRCLLVNSGNANAGTGQQGIVDAQQCCRALASLLSCNEENVLPFSTGVIGENLPLDKITKQLPTLVKNLNEDAWPLAANGILTTDTRAKLFSRQIVLQGEAVSITGMAKGAGMIRPNMATLLAYIGTDACIEEDVLSSCLTYAVDKSFNRITVDGDTSTNDACVLIATQRSKMAKLDNENSADYICFRDALTALCEDLAKDLIRDAEGATKLVTIVVNGGATLQECQQTAYTIAHSPLTKTALFASDPNWGRILAAVGRSDIKNLDVNNVSISLDDVEIAHHGGRCPNYREADAQRVMDKSEFSIVIDLGRGESHAQVWTCDLSYEYIKINAEYRS